MNRRGHGLGWAEGLLFVGMSFLLYGALVWADRERTMGDVQRIFYVHAPAGMVSLIAFVGVFLASVAYLVTRERRFDILAASTAEGGVLLATVNLVTGPIWAKPVWGVWWDWQSFRLVSMLALWIAFIAYLMLRAYVPSETKRANVSAVWAIVAALDAPLVYYSIRFLKDTAHPSAVIDRAGGLEGSMRVVFWLGVLVLFVLLILVVRRRMTLERLRDRLDLLTRRLAPARYGVATGRIVLSELGVLVSVVLLLAFTFVFILPETGHAAPMGGGAIVQGGQGGGAADEAARQVEMGAKMEEWIERNERRLAFLFWAYTAVWAILLGYFFSLSCRQRKLEREVAEPEERVRGG